MNAKKINSSSLAGLLYPCDPLQLFLSRSKRLLAVGLVATTLLLSAGTASALSLPAEEIAEECSVQEQFATPAIPESAVQIDDVPLGGESPDEINTYAAGMVGSLATCAAICNGAVPSQNDLWNLACYNMCASGRAIGCNAWLTKCTTGPFFGIAPCAQKRAMELCLIAYNAMC